MAKIGIDLDDTVWNFYEPFILDYNEEFGTTFSPKNFIEYDFAKFFGIDTSALLKKFSEFEKKKGDKILFYPDFLYNFAALAKENQIYFITARSKEHETAVVKRLEKLNCGYSLYFSRSFDNCWSQTKGQICEDKGIKYMIEDNIRNAEKINEKGIEVFLLERPWTKNYQNPKIQKVKDWYKISKKILK